MRFYVIAFDCFCFYFVLSLGIVYIFPNDYDTNLYVIISQITQIKTKQNKTNESTIKENNRLTMGKCC